MVLGILSLVCLSIVAGIPAVITGHVAHRRAKKVPDQYGGRGLALAGLIMGYASVAVAVGIVLFAPSLWLAAAKAQGEATAGDRAQAQAITCFSNLKQISIALRMYAADHQDVYPSSFMQITNELGSPRVLICPVDPQRSGSQKKWDSSNISYEFLTPGVEKTNVLDEAVVRCPFHGNVVRGDGTVEMGTGKP